MLRLTTFGGLRLEASAGAETPKLSSQRLALLAVIASAGERGVSRERAIGLFWPDVDEEHARHSLRQALYALRHEVGVEIPPASASLSVSSSLLSSDITEFHDALARGDRTRAIALASGTFLDGFYLRGGSGFQRWMDEERNRLQGAICGALLGLAQDSKRLGHLEEASAWWRQLTERDPLNGRYAAGYLASLAASGERAQALSFARAHGELVRRELDAEADPGVQQLEAELRSRTVPASAHTVSPRSNGAVSSERDVEATTGSGTEALAEPATEPAYRATPSPRVSTPHITETSTATRTRSVTVRRVLGMAAVAVLLVPLWHLIRDWWPSGNGALVTIAVGPVRDASNDKDDRTSGVLTDMLSTNLARIDGLQVLANSRMLEAMRTQRDTNAAGYAEAALRAGATELLEGTVHVRPDSSFAMDVRRVDLRRGVVRGAFRVTARDRFALVDSVTSEIARRFDLDRPRGSIADATTRSPVAYRLYEEGLRAYYAGDAAGAYRLMVAAGREDSTFAIAAYYEALLAENDSRNPALYRALRLGAHAADRERLLITADLMSRLQSPNASSVAETLATRFPNDPRAHEILARSLNLSGEWAEAVRSLERAIVLDSATDMPGRGTCFVCDDFYLLTDTYFWWDSLDAADRSARRLAQLRPRSNVPWTLLASSAARRGDSVSAFAHYHRGVTLMPNVDDVQAEPRLNLTLERYEQAERSTRSLLASPRANVYNDGHWLMLIALRNEGRLHDAQQFMATGRVAGFPSPVSRVPYDDLNNGLVALESGNTSFAVSEFARRKRDVARQVFPGLQARGYAWTGTLLGMALGASGDTAYLRSLADTVQYWGERSAFGRDRRAHHYLRGLLAAARGHDDDAEREFRAAMHSPSLGFTRVNYELARVLLRRGQPKAAVAVLQPALRGEIDASNLYVTRTDLHELLAESFARADEADSAAVHYRAVLRAWQRADPKFEARRARARDWLLRHEPFAHTTKTLTPRTTRAPASSDEGR